MKGYWLVLGTDVTDPEAQAEYGRLWAPIAAKYGARVRRGNEAPELVEAGDKSRILLVEFESLDVARACYDDPDYQAARAFAKQAATRELAIFEGNLG
ncbi:DUF1330 domain-containing protein [Yangia mangrovi]|uniref:DUF1330 domain-containing protein n=1 Tax=Alloyangia mangrovi TaxID=1779329 RepID=A0A2A3JYK6_9RHOB|nr:DUF1330 domain-containing protein [Alloyangia mangrovi]MCT4369162.1 DUF1330 domain-containing protein [Alloyangia mangrovi]